MTTIDQQHDTDQQRDTCYTIISRLGKGGEGLVYLAQDRQSGRYVAMKEARKDNLNHERSMLLRIHEKIPIRGIPRLLDTLYYSAANRAYMSLVIDYIEGRCMENIPYLSLPLSTVTDYITQFFRITDALHRQRFVHYDLHDGNILCGNDGPIYVVDFGLADQLEPHQFERIHYEIETMLMIVRDWITNLTQERDDGPCKDTLLIWLDNMSAALRRRYHRSHYPQSTLPASAFVILPQWQTILRQTRQLQRPLQ